MCLPLWLASTQSSAAITSLERTPSGREMLIASIFGVRRDADEVAVEL